MRIDDNLTKLGQLQKDMEATRIDIFEKMSQSMEAMSTNLTKETDDLRTSYESMTDDLKARSNKIATDFREKMLHIKTTISSFFSKVEDRMDVGDKLVARL